MPSTSFAGRQIVLHALEPAPLLSSSGWTDLDLIALPAFAVTAAGIVGSGASQR